MLNALIVVKSLKKYLPNGKAIIVLIVKKNLNGKGAKMKTKEDIKRKIKEVKREMKNEPSNSKKARLNKYKQKLEIRLRDFNGLNAI